MKRFISAALCAALGFATAGMATAAGVNMQWSAPTTRADGSALSASEIGGYEIDLNGTAIAAPKATDTSYGYAIAAGSCVQSSDTFTIRVKDAAGTWSAFSSPVTLGAQACTPKAAPAAPTLKLTVSQ